MKSSDSKVAKAHHPDMEQPQTGQVTLFVLAGRLLTSGNSEKKTNAENVCTGYLAVQRIKHHEMVKSTNTHHGALSVRSRQADRVPGLMPRGGPTHATGGHPAPQCGARPRKRRANATGQTNPNSDNKTRPLNILQWNAEGAYRKKISLTERLHRDKIDVACIQETHLNPNHRFSIRGYQTFRMDREGRQKGGVLILVKNASQLRTSKLTLVNSLKYTVHTSPSVIQLSPFLTFTVPQTKILRSIQ